MTLVNIIYTCASNEIPSSNRRKSALPKYEPPPYLKHQQQQKRMMQQMQRSAYSHPNSPHPSQLTPDHVFGGPGPATGMGPAGGSAGAIDGSKLSLGGGGYPNYRE